jgi:hypothetical protein
MVFLLLPCVSCILSDKHNADSASLNCGHLSKCIFFCLMNLCHGVIIDKHNADSASLKCTSLSRVKGYDFLTRTFPQLRNLTMVIADRSAFNIPSVSSCRHHIELPSHHHCQDILQRSFSILAVFLFYLAS